jgi:hypothetical protein
MSFDLFAQGFKAGEADERHDHRDAVDAVLQPFTVTSEGGFRRTRTLDGGEADFYMSGGGAGFMVSRFSKGKTMDLIVRAAKAGGVVIVGGGIPAVLTDCSQLDQLLVDLLDPPPLLVDTGAALSGVIDDDIGTIDACRARLREATRDFDGRSRTRTPA